MMTTIFRPNKFTGWHMATVMVLFFGTIISVNLTLAYYANTTWTGLVVKNSYIASQSFDEETARRKEQLALGWNIQSQYGGGLFSISVADASGEPIVAKSVVAKIGRPATETDDREFALNADIGGRFSGKTELADGLWQADITVKYGDDQVWNRSVRFTVKK